MRWMEHGRTRWLGAAVGTCLVTAVGVSSALAQDATPVPSDQATPSTQTTEVAPGDNRASAAEKTALAEQLQRVTDTIATVQKDRDTVGGAGDWTAVDDLLTKATQFRDAAKATLDGDDVSAAHGQLFAAEGTAMAAEALIRAQLSDYGLPSQQAGASRTLVAAYNQIDEVSGRLSAGTDENAKGLATTAQALYKSATISTTPVPTRGLPAPLRSRRRSPGSRTSSHLRPYSPPVVRTSSSSVQGTVCLVLGRTGTGVPNAATAAHGLK